jgi:hypothetical protein
VVLGRSHCWVWLVSLDAYWAHFMDCLSYGRCHHCAQGVWQDRPGSPCTRVLFPPSLVWMGLGHACGMAGGLCWSLTLLGPPLVACNSSSCMHTYAFISFLISFLGECQQVTVASMQLATVAAALNVSQDLPTDCLSCGRDCTWGGGVWACVWCRGLCQSSPLLGLPPGLWFF